MLLPLLAGATAGQTSCTVQPGGLNSAAYTASFAPAASSAAATTAYDFTGWARYPKKTVLATPLLTKIITPYEAKGGVCRKLCAVTFNTTCVALTLAPQNTYFPGAYDCTLFKPEAQAQVVQCANTTKGIAMVLTDHPSLNTSVDGTTGGAPVS